MGKPEKKIRKKLSQYLNYKDSGMVLPKILENTIQFIREEPSSDQDFQKHLEQHLADLESKIGSEIKVLQQQIEALQGQIDSIYADVEGENTYKLHSVLVHDGLAGIGHYWAFVFDHKKRIWLKFNDTQVQQVNQETVFRESEGGHSTRSAYCLFYVSELALSLSLSVTDRDLKNLIPDLLKQSILRDNMNLGDQNSLETLLRVVQSRI